MEMQCPPEGVPKDFQLPSRGRPMPKPPAGRNKEGRKGKGGPHREEKGKKLKKHRKTTPHCDKQIQGSKTRVQCAVTGGAYDRALYPGF